MLTADRYDAILQLLAEKHSVTVPELTVLLDSSESTVRRDLIALDKQGKLVKVHGGAISPGMGGMVAKDDAVVERTGRHHEEKLRIAKHAAGLVQPQDFVYIDAGTTTALLAGQLTEAKATYVTNSLSVAQTLAAKGMRCYLPGGLFKSETEAIVGEQALQYLAQLSFTKGFFGTNGVSAERGFTTPEPGEAAVKKQALYQCHSRYILTDPSKFGLHAPVRFADFAHAQVITTGLTDAKYKQYRNITEV